MSIGVILRVTRDFLQSTNSWTKDQCRVTMGGEPYNSSGPWFVGLDDDGVDPVGDPEQQDYLGEHHRILVWVWRRAGSTPTDRRGNLALDQDPYIQELEMIAGLERKVIKAIHGSHPLRNCVNAGLQVPDESSGDIIQTPLFYAGRSKTQLRSVTESTKDPVIWAGRSLRFTGMKRIQSIGCMG